MNKIIFSPDEVLEQLKVVASPRKIKSLDLLHTICREQQTAGRKDFSVVTIGRISAKRGGPSEQPIRNKPGEAYRVLLASWANFAGTSTRKPAAPKTPSLSNDLLEMIDDPSVRLLVGSILAERKQLRNENALLKKHANIVIDNRPSKEQPSSHASVVQILPKIELSPLEVDALKELFDKEYLIRMGWKVDTLTGRVTKGSQPIFKPGFATAINKVIEISTKPPAMSA